MFLLVCCGWMQLLLINAKITLACVIVPSVCLFVFCSLFFVYQFAHLLINWFCSFISSSSFSWGVTMVIPGRSVGKTNVQYRGLIRPTVPLHRSTLPQTCFSICSLSSTMLSDSILSLTIQYFQTKICYFSFVSVLKVQWSWSATGEEKEKADDNIKWMAVAAQPTGLGLTLSEMTRNKVTANFTPLFHHYLSNC